VVEPAEGERIAALDDADPVDAGLGLVPDEAEGLGAKVGDGGVAVEELEAGDAAVGGEAGAVEGDVQGGPVGGEAQGAVGLGGHGGESD